MPLGGLIEKPDLWRTGRRGRLRRVSGTLGDVRADRLPTASCVLS